ncbi:MAG: hypothetical protein ACLQU4_03130, partial [Limisphaerales bacterium]
GAPSLSHCHSSSQICSTNGRLNSQNYVARLFSDVEICENRRTSEEQGNLAEGAPKIFGEGMQSRICNFTPFDAVKNIDGGQRSAQYVLPL